VARLVGDWRRPLKQHPDLRGFVKEWKMAWWWIAGPRGRSNPSQTDVITAVEGIK
jgi:hypothetical protein